MSRALSLLGLIAALFFSAPAAVSQGHDVRVTLFAFAEFPFWFSTRYDNVRYPPITEYKVFTEWVRDPYDKSRSPDFFELVAIVSNTSTVSVETIQLGLNRDRKIGDVWDFEVEPHPSENSQWEGAIPIATTLIDSLDGQTATVVRFGPFSAHGLLDDLLAQELWPWEVEYEVTLQCRGCARDTDSVSISMVHSH